MKNIDDFDISLNEYSQNRLFPTSADNGLLFNGSDYHYLESSTETTSASNDDGSLRNRALINNLQLSYIQKLYKTSILPIIDISDEFISKPQIIYSSGYILNNSKKLSIFSKLHPKNSNLDIMLKSLLSNTQFLNSQYPRSLIFSKKILFLKEQFSNSPPTLRKMFILFWNGFTFKR